MSSMHEFVGHESGCQRRRTSERLWRPPAERQLMQHIHAHECLPQVQKEETKADSKQQKLLEDMKKGGLDKATAQKVSAADV